MRNEIKEIETLYRYTDSDVAKKLGVCRETINRWKNGKTEPKDKTMQAKIEQLKEKAKAEYEECTTLFPKLNFAGKSLVENYEDAQNDAIRVELQGEGETIMDVQFKFKIGDKVKTSGGMVGHIAERSYCEGYYTKGNYYTIAFENNRFDKINEEFLEPYYTPTWTFTEDEKTILRNVDKDYNWLVRDRDGALHILEDKPTKRRDEFWWGMWGVGLSEFNHLFQSVQWTDKEPCEFRKFIGE